MQTALLDPHRLRLRSARAAGLAVVMAGAIASGLSACGESELATEYAEYSKSVEALLESESAVYDRWHSVMQLRQDDPAHPSYYALLQDDALPFYEELVKAVGDLEPRDPRIVAAHEHLTRFASARYEFASLELQARSVNVRARNTDGGLLELQTAHEQAEEAKNEYMRGVAGDVPDHRHSRLAQLVGDFQERQLPRFAEGTVAAADIQKFVRRNILPRIEEFRVSRLPEGAEGHRLAAEFDAWSAYFRLFAERAPLFQELLIAARKSTHAATEAEDEKTKFIEALEAVRRAM